jgi:hypothetical protein
LCAPCRIRYERLVRDRELGWKLVNYGFGALILGAILFAVLASSLSSLSAGDGEYLLAIPAVASALVMLYGGVLFARAALMRGAATRFVTAPTAGETVPPGVTPAPAQGGVPLLATSAAPIELQREPPTTPVRSIPAW